MPILHWLTRSADIEAASQVQYRVLEEVDSLHYGDKNSDNLLIQGDNLDALKALLPYYAGQVKCIYIDPPYNTGHAFEHYDDNVEHSLWLALMYPRLSLLRDFLTEDGIIWIQIDDCEQAYLKVMCDEIFGRENFVTTICIKMSHMSGVKMSHKGKKIPKLKEFILCYSKNKNYLSFNPQYEKCKWDEAFNRYNSFAIKNLECPDDCSQWTVVSLKEAAIKSGVNIKSEEEYVNFCMLNADCIFRTARTDTEEFKKLPNDDKFRVVTTARGMKKIAYKREEVLFCIEKLKFIDGNLNPATPIGDIWSDIGINNLHNEGGVEFKNGKKPEKLIQRVLAFSSRLGDIVMDTFLGSGTTAAVAHKMGRRYIGVEMGEHCVTHCQPRLVKVVDGEQGGISKSQNWTGGGGFRFYRLGAPLFNEEGLISREVTFKNLSAHIWFSETYSPIATGRTDTSAILGVHDDVAYVVLHPESSTTEVLTSVVLRKLKDELEQQGYSEVKKIVVYGESCRMGDARLREQGVVFKQIPYDVKAR